MYQGTDALYELVIKRQLKVAMCDLNAYVALHCQAPYCLAVNKLGIAIFLFSVSTLDNFEQIRSNAAI